MPLFAHRSPDWQGVTAVLSMVATAAWQVFDGMGLTRRLSLLFSLGRAALLLPGLFVRM